MDAVEPAQTPPGRPDTVTDVAVAAELGVTKRAVRRAWRRMRVPFVIVGDVVAAAPRAAWLEALRRHGHRAEEEPRGTSSRGAARLLADAGLEETPGGALAERKPVTRSAKRRKR